MKGGNKPISLDAHRKRGTHRNDRHGSPDVPEGSDSERPKVPKRMPSCPRDVLGKEGRKEFRRVVRLLKHSGMIGEGDRAQLVQYALLWEELIEARHKFSANKHSQLRLLAESLGISTIGQARR